METNVVTNGAEYRAVPGYPEYRVGSDGSFWSSWNLGNHKVDGKWRRLKGGISKAGYVIVSTMPLVTKQYLHRLVMLAFHGPSSMDVLHKNGIKTDNAIENLRYGTPKENSEDSRKHGTLAIGEKNGHAKLTKELVVELREQFVSRSREYGINALSRKYNLPPGCIKHAVNRTTWKHVA